jgi:hypothetical protein
MLTAYAGHIGQTGAEGIRAALPLLQRHALSPSRAPKILDVNQECCSGSRLIERDARYEEAMRIGDADFLQDLLADDFVWVHSLASATDTKAVVLAKTAEAPAGYKSRSASEVKAHALGDSVVLRGQSTVELGGHCKLLAVQTMKVWSSEAKVAP